MTGTNEKNDIEVIDITPKKDGGVLKKILHEGTGDEYPPTGSKVTVHYVGKLLDGTVFDSSRERGEPFQFDLGKGTVIKAWDIGVASMKKGEVALLTCAPQYAYGASGSPPKIPPNATLEFEVEVFSWIGEDLSPEKDFSIERLVLTPGKGYAHPNDGALVDVHLTGSLDGRIFEDRDVKFNLGEGCESKIIEGVEIALEKFTLGEQSKLIIKPKYAFKNVHNDEYNIPPNSTVEYIVTLNHFEKSKECWSMDSQERLEQAKLFKEKGTQYFKAGKYLLANKMYKKILTFIDAIEKPGPDSSNEDEPADDNDIPPNETRDLRLSAHLNLALCYLKLAQYIEARDACKSALALDANNVKAYFRRGQAYLEIGEAELALKDFEEVLNLDPTNKAAVTQVHISKKKILEQKSKEKKIYANMFEKFAKRDSEKEEEERRQQPDVMTTLGEWGEEERERAPTNFEKENPNILMLNNSGEFKNM